MLISLVLQRVPDREGEERGETPRGPDGVGGGGQEAHQSGLPVRGNHGYGPKLGHPGSGAAHC
jgi:hypothetical protein